MIPQIKDESAFAFTAPNRKWANGQIKKYPKGREASAVMPLLTRAQEQNNGWLSMAAIEHVAEYLNMPVIRVLEVASFYSMYYLKPVGRTVIGVCITTPCWLRGSDDVLSACRDELGIEVGETSEDGAFTLLEVECLGACVNAPVCSIMQKYYEDLDGPSMGRILHALKAGKTPKSGPQINRVNSAPASVSKAAGNTATPGKQL